MRPRSAVIRDTIQAPGFKIALAFVLASAAMSFIVISQIIKVREMILDETKKTVVGYTSLAEVAFDSALRRVDGVITNISHELHHQPMRFGSRYSKRLLELKEPLADIPGLELRIVDKDGYSAASTTDPTGQKEERVNLSTRDHYKEILTAGPDDVVLSEPFQGRVRKGVWLVVLAKRINGPDGKFLGSIHASMEVEYFANIRKTLQIGPEDILSIASGKKFFVLARYPPVPDQDKVIGFPLRFPGWAPILNGEKHNGLFEIKSPVDGIVRFTSITRVSKYPMIVRVGRGIDAQLAPWKKQSVLYLTILVILIFIAGSLVWSYFVGARELARQQALLAAATRTELDLEKHKREVSEKTNRSKDEFLATLSHELRTPLTTISMWAQMLRRGELSPAQMEQAFKSIEQNAFTQGQLINDLLDVSRIVAGKMPLNICETDLRTVILNAIDSVAPLAQGKAIELETELGSQNASVQADPARLQQVLWNLLTNAIKFSPSGSKVHVRLKWDGALGQIQIEDRGRGIDPGFLHRIFDRFSQADSSSVREHGGLGLGLAIVRDLVEKMGGEVRADSAGIGLGATFSIVFPLIETSSRSFASADDSSSPAPVEHPRRKSQRQRVDGIRVLMVDDNSDARAAFKVMLGISGAIVLTVATPDEAIDALPTFRPDVLFSDISMPGEDGYSLIRRVRALKNGFGSMPSVAMTAYAGSENCESALKSGFNAHLAKPVDWAEVTQLISNLVRHESPKAHVAEA